MAKEKEIKNKSSWEISVKEKKKGTQKEKKRTRVVAKKKPKKPQAQGEDQKTKPKSIDLTEIFTKSTMQKLSADDKNTQEKYISEARLAYARAGIVLYLGAGVSISVGMPSWDKLIQSLTVIMMTREVKPAVKKMDNLSEEQKVTVSLSLQEQVASQSDKNQRPVLMMARAIKEKMGQELPYEVAKALYRPLVFPSIFTRFFQQLTELFHTEKKLEKGKLKQFKAVNESKMFNAIVSLARAQRDIKGVQAIVNFNYDDMIDEYLRENDVWCDTILGGGDKERKPALPCYHVHGILPFRRFSMLKNTTLEQSKKIIGNFVFSEDEYHTEYSDPYRWSNMTMMTQLGRHTGLFIGLSLRDPNLRRLLDVTHRQYPDLYHYAILTRQAPRKEVTEPRQIILRDLFERVETESLKSIGIKAIWTDTYDEVPERIKDICNIDALS